MLRTIKYLKSIGSSMIRRPRKVHAAKSEESFEAVSVTCAWAGEGDEDVSERSNLNSALLAADQSSDGDCESLLSDDTVYGRRYRTVRVYGVVDPSFTPEDLATASPRTSATDPGASTLLNAMAPERAPGVRWFQMTHSRGDFDGDTLIFPSFSTRYVEESFKASDDEDWEHDSQMSDETK
eukprot:TRINITY_DN13575_c0_g5_i1.p1 TRINITY_DN13575_c0_g5~~TRINITY_DN13575_c0_g5_i1.p1  ORF type:complete len:181 (-),score=28.28 TRINITY_DN13575_c0_g5_i1:214-756(-)